MIISCVSINAVKIVKGEKGDAGRDGINGLNGTKGAMGLSGKDGEDGEDGLTPYIKDNYWWIGDTNTGYLAGNFPCYVEVVTKSKTFFATISTTEQEVLNFCLNNSADKIVVSYSQSSSNCWYIPSCVNIGEDYKYSSSITYKKVILKDIINNTLGNIP